MRGFESHPCHNFFFNSNHFSITKIEINGINTKSANLKFEHRNCLYNLITMDTCSKSVGVFSVSSPPPAQPYWQNYYPPLADMFSWAVWFKFLFNKIIANTCLFILTSFSKQSASWKVLEICELCALSADSRKTYSVNKYMYTGSSSYSFDWGGGGGGEETEKTQVWHHNNECVSLKMLLNTSEEYLKLFREYIHTVTNRAVEKT